MCHFLRFGLYSHFPCFLLLLYYRARWINNAAIIVWVHVLVRVCVCTCNVSERDIILNCESEKWPWSTKPVISVHFSELRFIHHLKAESIIFPLMCGLLWLDNIWKSGIWGCKKIEILRKSSLKFLAMHITQIQTLSFDIFTVGNVQNIFMEHDFYLIS